MSEATLISADLRPMTPTAWRTPSNPARSGFRRWAKRTLFVGIAAGLAAGLAVEVHHRFVVATVGPVSVLGGGMGQPIDIGVPFSFGYLLRNEGKKPAVVERVRVLGVTGPIEVLDVRARLHPSGPKPEFFMAAFGFPPPEYPSKPLADEGVVPVPKTFSESGSPYEGLQLIVGVRPTGSGIGRIRGVDVTYRVGHRRFHTETEGSGSLYAPAADYLTGGRKAHEYFGAPELRTWDDRSVDFHVATRSRQ